MTTRGPWPPPPVCRYGRREQERTRHGSHGGRRQQEGPGDGQYRGGVPVVRLPKHSAEPLADTGHDQVDRLARLGPALAGVIYFLEMLIVASRLHGGVATGTAHAAGRRGAGGRASRSPAKLTPDLLLRAREGIRPWR